MNLEKEQTANPFETSQASNKPPEIPTDSMPYYVVSKKKFFILFFLTFGLYNLYWFWKNWRLWKIRNNSNIWPIARTIFQVFYVYSIFDKIHTDAKKVDGSLKPLQLPATLYTAMLVVTNFINRLMPDEPITPLFIAIFMVLLLSAWSIWQAQIQANILSFDVDGNKNNRLTLVNYVFIVIGAVVWFLALLGIIFEMLGIV